MVNVRHHAKFRIMAIGQAVADIGYNGDFFSILFSISQPSAI